MKLGCTQLPQQATYLIIRINLRHSPDKCVRRNSQLAAQLRTEPNALLSSLPKSKSLYEGLFHFPEFNCEILASSKHVHFSFKERSDFTHKVFDEWDSALPLLLFVWMGMQHLLRTTMMTINSSLTSEAATGDFKCLKLFETTKCPSYWILRWFLIVATEVNPRSGKPNHPSNTRRISIYRRTLVPLFIKHIAYYLDYLERIRHFLTSSSYERLFL